MNFWIKLKFIRNGIKLESQIFAYLKHSFCSKKVNVMCKWKNLAFLQKFEIYWNVELLRQSLIGDDSSIWKCHYSLIYGPINLKFVFLA